MAAPDRPILILEPSRGWAALDLASVWAHRELLLFLTWRDIKIRYKQTALGAIWAIFQPLLPMVIFAVIFGRLAQMPSDGIPYAAFAYAGLLPWTYFANAVINSATSIVGSASLITKVYFPRMIIPGSAVLAALVDFLIASTVLVGLMLWYRVPFHTGLLVLPLLVLIVTTLALGVGLLCAGLTVKYRDVRHALPFAIQFWMFASPVIFPASLVPARWRFVLAMNPMTGVIEGFRAVLFGRPFDWSTVALSAAIATVTLVYAAYAFRRLERGFADTI